MESRTWRAVEDVSPYKSCFKITRENKFTPFTKQQRETGWISCRGRRPRRPEKTNEYSV